MDTEYTKEDFLAWLRAQPADTKFCDSELKRCETCPLAKFTGRIANYVVYEPGTWQREFMYAYDSILGEPTLADAIRIAESL